MLKGRVKEQILNGWIGKKTAPIIKSALSIIEEQKTEAKEQGVLITESDPWEFIGKFLAAVILEVPVFLGNPKWGKKEWGQVEKVLSPGLVFGDFDLGIQNKHIQLSKYKGMIMIPTGGSTGGVRFAMHSWDGLSAAAKGVWRFFNRKPLNAYCQLPLYHVSGLMQVVRGIISGGKICFGRGKPFEGGYISLVPTQLERFIGDEEKIKWLKAFDAIFLGGAPARLELLDACREIGLPIAPSYGFTESAAMVAMVKPKEFIRGQLGSGKALPHVKIDITENGLVSVKGKSLFYGYFPEEPKKREVFVTEDEGELTEADNLIIKGRRDRLIITGGEKVDPLEVEDVIRKSGLVEDVKVIGLKDQEWGDRLAAICVACETKALKKDLEHFVRNRLSYYKIPKKYIFIQELPYNEKGKICKEDLEALVVS